MVAAVARARTERLRRRCCCCYSPRFRDPRVLLFRESGGERRGKRSCCLTHPSSSSSLISFIPKCNPNIRFLITPRNEHTIARRSYREQEREHTKSQSPLLFRESANQQRKQRRSMSLLLLLTNFLWQTRSLALSTSFVEGDFPQKAVPPSRVRGECA